MARQITTWVFCSNKWTLSELDSCKCWSHMAIQKSGQVHCACCFWVSVCTWSGRWSLRDIWWESVVVFYTSRPRLQLLASLSGFHSEAHVSVHAQELHQVHSFFFQDDGQYSDHGWSSLVGWCSLGRKVNVTAYSVCFIVSFAWPALEVAFCTTLMNPSIRFFRSFFKVKFFLLFLCPICARLWGSGFLRFCVCDTDRLYSSDPRCCPIWAHLLSC